MELKVRVMDFDERLKLYDRFRESENRLILLDYDGTLVPYFDKPELAVPDAKTIDLLRQLASNSQNRVVVISGRDTHTLESWFKDVPVDLVAEHGAYYMPAGSKKWSLADFDSESWKPGVRTLFENFCNEYDGSFIEEKNHALTWHYRKARIADEKSALQRISRALTICNPTGQFNVMCGNKVIEVKNVNFDKGKFVADFIAGNKFDLVLAIGDDTTDEDMFMRLNGPNNYTLRVGLSGTAAMFNLIGVGNVHSFLDQLTYIRPSASTRFPETLRVPQAVKPPRGS